MSTNEHDIFDFMEEDEVASDSSKPNPSKPAEKPNRSRKNKHHHSSSKKPHKHRHKQPRPEQSGSATGMTSPIPESLMLKRSGRSLLSLMASDGAFVKKPRITPDPLPCNSSNLKFLSFLNLLQGCENYCQFDEYAEKSEGLKSRPKPHFRRTTKLIWPDDSVDYSYQGKPQWERGILVQGKTIKFRVSPSDDASNAYGFECRVLAENPDIDETVAPLEIDASVEPLIRDIGFQIKNQELYFPGDANEITFGTGIGSQEKEELFDPSQSPHTPVERTFSDGGLARSDSHASSKPKNPSPAPGALLLSQRAASFNLPKSSCGLPPFVPNFTIPPKPNYPAPAVDLVLPPRESFTTASLQTGRLGLASLHQQVEGEEVELDVADMATSSDSDNSLNSRSTRSDGPGSDASGSSDDELPKFSAKPHAGPNAAKAAIAAKASAASDTSPAAKPNMDYLKVPRFHPKADRELGKVAGVKRKAETSDANLDLEPDPQVEEGEKIKPRVHKKQRK